MSRVRYGKNIINCLTTLGIRTYVNSLKWEVISRKHNVLCTYVCRKVQIIFQKNMKIIYDSLFFVKKMFWGKKWLPRRKRERRINIVILFITVEEDGNKGTGNTNRFQYFGLLCLVCDLLISNYCHSSLVSVAIWQGHSMHRAKTGKLTTISLSTLLYVNWVNSK